MGVTDIQLPSEGPRPRWRNYLVIIAKLLVSFGIVFYFARNIALSSVLIRLRSIKPELFAASVAQLSLLPALGAVRWKMVLACLGYIRPLTRLGRDFWIGMAFNQILPTSVGGDAVRAWMIYRDGVRLADATVSILLERVVLLGVLLLMVVTAGLTGAKSLPPILFHIATLATGAGVAGLLLLPVSARVAAALPASRVVRLASDVANSLLKVVANYRVVPLTGLCLLTNLNLVLAAWWLGLSLNLEVNPAVYLVAIPAITLVTTLPISIGAWGLREAATISLLGPLVGPDKALLHSLAFGVALLLSSLPGFAFLVWKPAANRRWRSNAPMAAAQVASKEGSA